MGETVIKKFSAVASLDTEGWWLVGVNDVEFGYTQARTLDRIKPMVRDLLLGLDQLDPDDELLLNIQVIEFQA